MIIYNPLDGICLQQSIKSQPKHLFLMTRLAPKVPSMVRRIRKSISSCCNHYDYKVIDAQTHVTGRDYLLKIWKMIAAAPLSVGVLHEDIPDTTKANIFYELGVAQAMGKETLVIKSPRAEMPSDFARSEHISFDENFEKNFHSYLDSIHVQANYYETVADQLDKNPILALDYLKRAYLIKGDISLKKKASIVAQDAGIEGRAGNSIENLATEF